MSYFLTCDQPFSSISNCDGNLVNVVATLPFDVSQISPESVIYAFSSGFILAGVPLVFIFYGRLLLSIIKSNR